MNFCFTLTAFFIDRKGAGQLSQRRYQRSRLKNQMQNIAIVGGGIAGILVAIQLINRAKPGMSLTIFDKAGQFGGGLAYQPRQVAHLLNVPAGKMSLDPKAPDDFLQWLARQPAFVADEPAVLAQAYLPRALFGDYVAARWQEALNRAAQQGLTLELRAEEVTALDLTNKAEPRLKTEDKWLTFAALVLACGNELPRHPAGAPALTNHPAYVHNPWSDSWLQQLKPHSKVLILGNGLTMVDTLLSLRAAGLKTPVLSVSPHGYGMLPHRHPGLQLSQFSQALPEQASLRQLLRLFNRARHQVRRLGVSAEPLIDALRPHTQRYWQQFSLAEKTLFMRRLRHLWGVARHRVPLHLHDQLQQQRLNGLLEVHAGQVMQARSAGDQLILQICSRVHRDVAAQTFDYCADLVINCTGPEQDYRKLTGHPLQQAIAAGALAAGPLGLGLAADTVSLCVKDANDAVQPAVYAIGSLLRGELWESTALHEIRLQAQHIAGELLS